MRRMLSILALSLLLLVPATPALALVGRVSLYDGANGTSLQCGGFTAEDADLGSGAGCSGTSDNVTTSVQNQLAVDGAAKSCVVYYLGTSFTGSGWANHSQAVVNVPAGFDNAISSFRFGTWRFISGIGSYGCADPYS